MKEFDITKETDEYCLNIARVLLLGNDRLRFNELFRQVNELGAKMSKPTFSEHLNHLVERELVTRRVEGKQQVSYSFEWRRFLRKEEDLKELVKEERPKDERLADKKRFNALPIDEQVKEILLSLFERSIRELRLDVLSAIDSRYKFFNNLDKMMVSQTIDHRLQALLENCSKNNEFGKQVLERITLSKERLMNDPSETYKQLRKDGLAF